MLARIPQSGDSSGAALGVRSVALLRSRSDRVACTELGDFVAVAYRGGFDPKIIENCRKLFKILSYFNKNTLAPLTTT